MAVLKLKASLLPCLQFTRGHVFSCASHFSLADPKKKRHTVRVVHHTIWWNILIWNRSWRHPYIISCRNIFISKCLRLFSWWKCRAFTRSSARPRREINIPIRCTGSSARPWWEINVPFRWGGFSRRRQRFFFFLRDIFIPMARIGCVSSRRQNRCS